jgi:hypothetical protein
MDKLPQPAWACGLAFMGVVLALAVLFASGPDNIKLAVLAVASALVTGALGAFAGHSGSSQTISGDNPVVNQPAVLPQESSSSADPPGPAKPTTPTE